MLQKGTHGVRTRYCVSTALLRVLMAVCVGRSGQCTCTAVRAPGRRACNGTALSSTHRALHGTSKVLTGTHGHSHALLWVRTATRVLKKGTQPRVLNQGCSKRVLSQGCSNKGAQRVFNQGYSTKVTHTKGAQPRVFNQGYSNKGTQRVLTPRVLTRVLNQGYSTKGTQQRVLNRGYSTEGTQQRVLKQWYSTKGAQTGIHSSGESASGACGRIRRIMGGQCSAVQCTRRMARVGYGSMCRFGKLSIENTLNGNRLG